jgi:UDP-N-acetylmuramoyl-L-alanyl-D-glutamate--2,6-diaminopimelate ligase
MEEYFQAKQKLFLSLAKKRKNHPKVAIVNKDDLWSDRLIKSIPCQSMTFAIDASADVKATDIAFTNGGTSFHVHYKGQKVPFFWPLVGRFNVYNALAVISVGLSCGMSLEHLASILKTFESAPGRLDRVDNVLDLNIFVDYAHKEDALKNVLVTLRECCHGKLITVFGCGGDRDKQAFSDMVIVTTDNPRSEDPYAIVREIQSGFHNKDQHLVELDRKKAIEKAISLANKKDIILIAGKGHEKKQVFQHVTLDFDDKAIAEEYCRALKGET